MSYVILMMDLTGFGLMFSSKFTIIIFPLTFLHAFEVLPEEKIRVSLSFKPI